jgi:hypothetical protein
MESSVGFLATIISTSTIFFGYIGLLLFLLGALFFGFIYFLWCLPKVIESEAAPQEVSGKSKKMFQSIPPPSRQAAFKRTA